jgi:hypothetical protein
MSAFFSPNQSLVPLDGVKLSGILLYPAVRCFKLHILETSKVTMMPATKLKEATALLVMGPSTAKPTAPPPTASCFKMSVGLAILRAGATLESPKRMVGVGMSTNDSFLRKRVSRSRAATGWLYGTTEHLESRPKNYVEKRDMMRHWYHFAERAQHNWNHATG